MINVDFSPYQGFIFDLDGTLIDSMPFHVKAWQQVAKEHDYVIDPKFIYDRGGCSSYNIVLDLQKQGCNVGSVKDFVARKVELYRSNINQVPLFKKVFNVLTEAKERGAKIAIGTGSQRINVVDILQIHHISHLVDFIISADDVTEHKPHHQTYLKAMELMQLPPEQCIVIEDGMPGIKAASAAHIDCLVVDNDQFIKLNKA